MTDETQKTGEDTEPKPNAQNSTPGTAPKPVGEKPAVVRGLLSTKGAIEFFGRHPFVTGIFALLSLFGLGLSIKGFAIDREENKQSIVRDAETTESLKGVSSQIEKIATPTEPDMPLQIRGGEQTHDSWTFSREHMGQSKDWIIENAEYTGSAPYLSFSVASDAKKQFVQIAPYLAISVDTVQPFPQQVASIFHSERGGSAVLREFTGLIGPQEAIAYAPLDDETVDYMTLMPGEIEEFFLTLYFEPGYRYEYRVGIVYRFQGQNDVLWLPHTYTVGIPKGEIPLAGFDNVTFKTQIHDDVVDASDFNAQLSTKITTSLAAKKFMNPASMQKMIQAASNKP